MLNHILMEELFGRGIMRMGPSRHDPDFEGHVAMIGVECDLRQTWTKVSGDGFGFVNEERLPDGSWGWNSLATSCKGLHSRWQYLRPPRN